MNEELFYSIYVLDENTCNYTMIYSSTNIFLIINYYNYFIKRFPTKYVKVSRDIQIYKGELIC